MGEWNHITEGDRVCMYEHETEEKSDWVYEDGTDVNHDSINRALGDVVRKCINNMILREIVRVCEHDTEAYGERVY